MPRVAVIGGGPAGSLAAMLLARRGWQVHLFEQAGFPRDKVCGECLSALGWAVLERASLSQVLMAAGPTELRRVVFYSRHGARAEMGLPRTMYGLSRRAMDPLLLEEARAAGVAIHQPARVEAVGSESLNFVTYRRAAAAVTQTLECDVVVLADGRSAVGMSTPRPSGDLGLKVRLTGVTAPASSVGLYAVVGCYVGLAPIESGGWNMAMSVPADAVRVVGGRLEEIFRRVLEENTALGEHLRSAVAAGPWMASPLPRFGVRKDWPVGVVPVGNAAAAIEPIGGEGMGLALRSAELAVSAIDDARGPLSPADVVRLQGQYRSLWAVRRGACRAAAVIVSRRIGQWAGVSTLRALPMLGRGWMQLAGKAPRDVATV